MVEVIYDLKNQLLDEMLKEVRERGIDHLDREQVDMIKDFAEAEKDCWKAAYYRSITEAMEEGQNSGYSSGMMMPMPYDNYGYNDGYGNYGYNGMSGAQGGSMGRSNSQSGGNRGGNSNSGYRNSMGQYARRGYNTLNRGYGMGYHEHVNALKMELMNANPQERERIMQELRAMETMQ